MITASATTSPSRLLASISSSENSVTMIASSAMNPSTAPYHMPPQPDRARDHQRREHDDPGRRRALAPDLDPGQVAIRLASPSRPAIDRRDRDHRAGARRGDRLQRGPGLRVTALGRASAPRRWARTIGWRGCRRARRGPGGGGAAGCPSRGPRSSWPGGPRGAPALTATLRQRGSRSPPALIAARSDARGALGSAALGQRPDDGDPPRAGRATAAGVGPVDAPDRKERCRGVGGRIAHQLQPDRGPPGLGRSGVNRPHPDVVDLRLARRRPRSARGCGSRARPAGRDRRARARLSTGDVVLADVDPVGADGRAPDPVGR